MSHMWAAITIVPIEIIPPTKPDQQPEVIQRLADEHDTQFGCSACSCALSSETYNTPCPAS